MIPLERHRNHLTPSKEVTHRITTFQSNLKAMEVSLAWIDHLPDRYYFTGSIQDGVLLIPAEGEPFFFVRKSLSRAEVESPLKVLAYPGRRDLLKKIKGFLRVKDRIGMAMDVTPASLYVWLKEQVETCTLVDISRTLRLQKAVKSAWEIAQIEKASQQANTLFLEMNDHLRPGITELELSASLEARLRILGHSGVIRIRHSSSDLPILSVVSGDSALYPTNFDGPAGGEGPYPSSAAGSGWKTITDGETIMVDLVTAYNGYHADHTRTFFLGKNIPQKAQTAHRFCIDVLDRLEQSLQAGQHCTEVFQRIHAWVKKQDPPEGFMGYGENRVKFFGHGIGLELDEFPIIADKTDLELASGMTIAMEPKAFLQGIGPVGLENTYVITDKGCQKFCTASYGINRMS